MVGTILVPHDGHSMSDKALNYAINLAKAMNMSIKIIRVVDEGVDVQARPQLRDVERERVIKKVEQQKAEIREREYNRLKKQIARANSKGVEASAKVVEGDAVKRLISIINKERPYMIIVGSRKLSAKGLSKVKILGSVARKLSEESKSPILIVR